MKKEASAEEGARYFAGEGIEELPLDGQIKLAQLGRLSAEERAIALFLNPEDPLLAHARLKG